MKTSSNSAAVVMNNMPAAPKTTSAKNSPWLSAAPCMVSSETSRVTRTIPQIRM